MDTEAHQHIAGSVYQPLPTPTSIRLLHREGKDEHGRLRFTMHTVDLRDRPFYHCLSYTWGNPHADGIIFREEFKTQGPLYEADSYTILLNDWPMQIHKNLHDGMEQLPMNSWAHRVTQRHDYLNGQTVVHMSSKKNTKNGHYLLKLHLNHGGDPSSQDHNGKTPAHYAAQCKNFFALKILIDAGADVTIKDHDGKLPLAYSWEQGDVKSTQILVSAMVGRSESSASLSTGAQPTASFDDFLWIDALCINQEDVVERTHQVSIMAMIYTGAGYVLVWLGEEDRRTATAIQTVKKIVKARKDLGDGSIIPFVTCDQRIYKEKGIAPISREEWDSLAALMARQWFKRIWIIQEAVFAGNLVMYCGTHEVVFGELARVVDILRETSHKLGYEPSLRYIPLDEHACSLEFHFTLMSELRDKRHCLAEGYRYEDGSKVDEIRFSLSRLIVSTFPFHATNPMDKIYAILSLTQMCRSLQLDIRPDYRSSVKQCYTQTAAALIESSRSLAVLSWVQASDPTRIPKLPSWVPDFNARGLNMLPISRPRIISLLPTRPFWADTVRLKLFTLGVEALQCDIVAFAAGPRLPKFTLDPSWFTLLEGVPATYHTGESRGEVLWRTLCANADSKGQSPAPTAFAEGFKRLLCALLCEDAERALSSALTMFEAITQISGKEDGSSLHGVSSHADLLGRHERELRNAKGFGVGGSHFERAKELLKSTTRLIAPTSSNALAFSAYDNCIPTLLDLDQYFRSSSTVSTPGASISEGVNRDGKRYTTIRMPCSPPAGARFISAATRKESRNAFAIAHNRHYSGRKLFVTEGGYLGLSSADVTEGDRIFFLNGGNGPFILRPVNLKDEDQGQGRQYKLVGESYIHGVEHMLQKLGGTAAFEFERIELV